MKAKIAILVLIVSLAGCSQAPTAQVNNTIYQLEIADTPELQRQGLQFRESLPQNQGMLFVFEEPKIQSFWMKDTLIPLDIIFLDKNSIITDIYENTPTCSEINPTQSNCPTYKSTLPAKYVLELNAGESQKNDLKISQKIILQNT